MSVDQASAGPARNLSGLDYFLLWAGVGIALPEIWAGGLITGLGLSAGLCAILAGHLIGNGLMVAAGHIGAVHGIPAIISTRAALGRRGAWLAGALNLVQLIGWTGFMVWIGGYAISALKILPGVDVRLWMLLLGVLTTGWAAAGQKRWRLLQRFSVYLLLILCVFMTITLLRTHPWSSLASITPATPQPFLQGMDLVLAMCISWLPLASDYTRYARKPASCAWGTYLGYFLGSCWMFALGLMAALATGTSTPDAMVIEIMARGGWILPAVLVIVVSTFSTTFLDIYSSAISAQSLFPRLSERALILLCGAAGTGLAMGFDAMSYEPFLLIIGSAFCPLFGIVLCDYYLGDRRAYNAEALTGGQPGGHRGGLHVSALVAWIAGFLLYQAASRQGWPVGASIPSLLAAGCLYKILSLVFRRSTKATRQEPR